MESSLLKLDDVVFRYIKDGKRNIIDHTSLEIKSKGFSGKNDRTYLEVTKVRWYDVLLSLITLTTISTAMFILR